MTDTLREQLQSTLSGAYDIKRELGGGGMSRVFLAGEMQSLRNNARFLAVLERYHLDPERFYRRSTR